MFTIPVHGWCQWHCYSHITIINHHIITINHHIITINHHIITINPYYQPLLWHCYTHTTHHRFSISISVYGTVVQDGGAVSRASAVPGKVGDGLMVS